MGRETERILYIPKKDHLNKNRTHEIWFNDLINADSISVLRNLIEKINVKTPEEQITLKINSAGGMVWEVMHLTEYFKNIQNPIKTIAEDRCMSGAVLLVAAGDERSAWENCQFLIHEIQIRDFTYSGPLSRLKEQVEDLDKLNTRFLSLLSDLTGQPLAKVYEDTKKDKRLSSKEALAYGIIDNIIPRYKNPPKKLEVY